MKVQDAASAAGSYDEQEADELIRVLKTADNPIRKKIISLRKKNPTVPLEKIVKKAEEPDQTLKLQLTLGKRWLRRCVNTPRMKRQTRRLR